MRKILILALALCTFSLTGCLNDNSENRIEITELELKDCISKISEQVNVVATYTLSVFEEYQEYSDSEIIYENQVTNCTYIFNNDLYMEKYEETKELITGSIAYICTEFYDFENDMLYSSYDNSNVYSESSINATALFTTYDHAYNMRIKSSFLSNFLLDEFITSYEVNDHNMYNEKFEIYKTDELDLVYVNTRFYPSVSDSFYSSSRIATYTYTYSFVDSVIEIPKL